jgi:long-chain acyl-CoA synthetase
MLDHAHIYIPDIFTRHGRDRATQEAVVCGDVRRVWRDFNANMNRVANRLLAMGIAKGDKVGVLMGNSVDILEVMFGVVKSGACVVPISGLLTADQMGHLLLDSGASVIIASPEYIERLDQQRGQLAGVAADHWIVVHGYSDGWRPYEDWLSGVSIDTPKVTYQPEDDFNIIYSSGTTGLPKGIVQAHRARSHWAVSNAIEMGFRDHSRALTTTSLYSNGTWLMMLPVLFAGGTCVVMPSFDPGAFLDALDNEHITHTFMVPAQFIAVLEVPPRRANAATKLEVVLCAGSPLRRDTKRKAIALFGPVLYELYGFSEGFSTMLKPSSPEDKFHTVGTPVLGFDVRILNDDGDVLAAGEVGEIAGYGAGMLSRYHGRPDATEAMVWKDERGRTFVRSGDIGYLDEDGFLILVDRKKDMIISGGFNVFPADIEAIIGTHPGVLDCTVIGIAHPKWGETPLALVIRKTGIEIPSDDLIVWCNERLAKHQRITALEWRESFPRNALGKVLKRELRLAYEGATDV